MKIKSHQEAFDKTPEQMPVFGTIASHFNDLGVTALYQYLIEYFNEHHLGKWHSNLAKVTTKITDIENFIIPPDRVRYLAEIAETVEQ